MAVCTFGSRVLHAVPTQPCTVALLPAAVTVKPCVAVRPKVACAVAAPVAVEFSTVAMPLPGVLSKPEEGAFASRYAVGEVLGQGSHGTVYEAVDKVTGEELAVKVIPKLRFGGRTQRSALHKEVNIWRRACTATQQATRIYSIEEDFSNLYIVQERCHGGSLQELLDARGGLTEMELGEVAFCVLTFLSNMHANGLYYGDLKPGNVILKDTYLHPCQQTVQAAGSAAAIAAAAAAGAAPPHPCMNVKIVDFGCSQMVSPSTTLRMVSGTPFFSAPEVIRGCYGVEADLWAMGVMLYTLVCNRLPFWLEPVSELEMMDVDAVYSSILNNPVIFAGAKWRGVSEQFKDLVWQLLQKDPAQRPSAKQALAHPWFDTVREMCQLQ